LSSTSNKKKENRDKEKEDFIIRLLEIQKEEKEQQQQAEDTHKEAYPIKSDFFIRQFYNEENFNLNNKYKRKDPRLIILILKLM
jgi:hypothetical protein